MLVRELVDDVGRVLGRHPIEDQRHLDVVEGAHELEQRGVVELGQHVAGLVRPERAKDRGAVGDRQVLEDVAEVGRVSLGERLPRARIVAILEQLFGRA